MDQKLKSQKTLKEKSVQIMKMASLNIRFGNASRGLEYHRVKHQGAVLSLKAMEERR